MFPLKESIQNISPKSWPCALSFPCTYRRENPSYILDVPCGHSGVSLVWLCRVIRNPWATEAVPGGPGGPCKPSGPGGPCIPREPVHGRETQHTVLINTTAGSFRINIPLKRCWSCDWVLCVSRHLIFANTVFLDFFLSFKFGWVREIVIGGCNSGASLCCRGILKLNTLRVVKPYDNCRGHGSQWSDFNQLLTSKTYLPLQLKIMLKYLAQDHKINGQKWASLTPGHAQVVTPEPKPIKMNRKAGGSFGIGYYKWK